MDSQSGVLFYLFIGSYEFSAGWRRKKYIRFFMGMILILLLLRPILQLSGMGTELERQVLEDSLGESFEEMMRETGRQEIVGGDYVKNACQREMKMQLEQLMNHYGYEIIHSETSFFDGELLELQSISLELKSEEKKSHDREMVSAADREEFIKNKLMEVYNIPEGNINISIQG